MSTTVSPPVQLVIRARGVVLTDDLRDHITRRVFFALSRVSRRLQRVDVTLEDVNGPRGGIDKACRLRIRAPGLADMFIAERDADLTSAINLATTRAGHTVTRAFAALTARRARPAG